MIKSGKGWRLGWNPEAEKYKGLIGSDDWAIELTEGEFQDFCRLLGQLADTMIQMNSELMDEEKIACDAETELLWMEVEGYPHSYTLQVILQGERRCEGRWTADSVKPILDATKILETF